MQDSAGVLARKVLHPDLGATFGAERFQREIVIASRLTGADEQSG